MWAQSGAADCWDEAQRRRPPHQGLGLELGISRAWEGAAVSGEGQGKSRHLGADIRPDESLDPNPTGHHLGRTPSLWPLCEDSMDAQARPRAGVQ